MINSSTLDTPLSPRTQVVKHRSRKLTIGSIVFLCLVGAALGFYFLVSSLGNKVQTLETQEQMKSGAEVLTLGDYKVCDWEQVELDTHIPLTFDGIDGGFFDVNEDMLIQGVLCGTTQEVLLALDDQGLHGSIVDSDNVVVITAIDQSSSTFMVSDQELPRFEEFESVEAVNQKWKDYMSRRRGGRRVMNALQPGSVDIHIHLDIDSHMVQTHGTPFAAARYGVELMAVVNRDAYINLGFNLKVVSINVRSSYLSSSASTIAYLNELAKIPRPVNVNLLHSLSTRSLGGGVAYLGGLYTRGYCYGVSAVYGNFHTWDRYVVAHELGHNFGADHTHEMNPPVDTCGFSCPSNPVGTIMSYCHLCSGGLSNLRYEWAPRVRDRILDTYASENHLLATRFACQSFPYYPDVGVAFSLKGDDCLTIDTSACTACTMQTCSLDSIYTFTGTQVKAIQDQSFCWTASNNCNSISLQTCGSSQNQQFSFSQNSLISATCGAVKYQGTTAKFQGSTVQNWCSPDEDPTDGPSSCDQTVVALSCGDTHTGSTVNDCNGERMFTFVAPNGPVSVSTCGSSYDTTLTVYAGSTNHFSDDDGNCNLQAELLDMSLTQGVEYTIILAGYGGATGAYNLAITCPNAGETSAPTTSKPSLAPTTSEPTEACDSSIVQLECGNPVTGSTVNSCDGTKQFTFTATTSMKTISTCGSQYDTVMNIYDSNNQLLASNDDSNECGLRALIKDLALTIGSQYVVVLAGYNNQVGDYNVELTCDSDAVTQSPSFDPTTDPTLDPTTSLPTAQPTTTPGTCESTTIQLACGQILTGSTVDSCDGEQRFTFTASTDLKTISTCGSSYDTWLNIYSDDGQMIYEQDDSDECGTRSHIQDLALTMGSEYTIVLSGYSGAVGEYSIGLECQNAPTCDSIPLQCGDVVSGRTSTACDSEQEFTFTATTSLKTISACQSSYDTTLSLYDSNGVRIAYEDDDDNCGLQSVLEHVPLNIGSEYTVVLDGYGGAVGDFTLELTCTDGPPPCEDSILTLTCGDVLAGSTVDSCTGEQKFQFTATSGLTTVSSCGSSFDTMLNVASDNGFDISNDDSSVCGRHSVISDMNLVAGDNHVVTLSGYGRRRGNWRVGLTCTATQQQTYTTYPGGKCQTTDGQDPSHTYHHGVSSCEELCNQSMQCFGYSMSQYNNCLLWTQSNLMGGGADWGGAGCHIKDANAN